MFRPLILWLLMVTCPCSLATNQAHPSDHVILLHGLCRTKKSMQPIAAHLTQQGFFVHNIAYKSRSADISTLSQNTVSRAVANAQAAGAQQIHFVTHSLGAILVRDYLSRHQVKNLGYTVMLAPPNHGSEVVDKIGHWKVFQWLNGPAGNQLGTSNTGFIATLPEPDFSLGVITGTRSFNWINSCFMIEGKDDGKVSLKSAQIHGAEFQVIPATHTFIMRKKQTLNLVSHFLTTGHFPQ